MGYEHDGDGMKRGETEGFQLKRRTMLGSVAAAVGSRRRWAPSGSSGWRRPTSRCPRAGPSSSATSRAAGTSSSSSTRATPRASPTPSAPVNLIETRYNDLEGFNGFSGQLVRPATRQAR
jgi:hypothetical protein